MKYRLPVFLCTALFILAAAVPAGAEGMALTAKAGTLGAGAEVTVGLGRTVNARVGVNYLPYSYTGTESDVEYEFDLTLQSGLLLLDWHPFGGAFRLSGGVVLNNNELEGVARPKDTVDIGGVDYAPAQVGKLTGVIDFEQVVPYAGIGFGNAVAEGSRWGVSLDLGVVFQGTPEASLSADGPIAGNPIFQADLAREEADLQDDLDEFRYYPVLSLGINYRF